MASPKEFLSSASGILALVFSILGVVFLIVGIGMTIGAIVSQSADAPAAVRLPMLGIGTVFLVPGAVLLLFGIVLGRKRVAVLRTIANLREHGLVADGTIVSMEQNRRVRVNRRHPWIVAYRFRVNGADYDGSFSTMDKPAEYVVGAPVRVRYDRSDPAQSTLSLV